MIVDNGLPVIGISGDRSIRVFGAVGLIVSTIVTAGLSTSAFFFLFLFAFFFLAAFFEVVIGLSCQVINSLVSVIRSVKRQYFVARRREWWARARFAN